METYIVIRSMARTPKELDSYLLPFTKVVGARFSAVGDRIMTVWATQTRSQAFEQAHVLWADSVEAIVLDTPESVGNYIENYVKSLPEDWR